VLNFCCSHEVLNGSPTCYPSSLCVPNIFPIALTSSHMFCPKFHVTYIMNPKEEITTYLFWEGLRVKPNA
jgi:hypothetical protein